MKPWTGYGIEILQETVTSAKIVAKSEIPEEVTIGKMGIRVKQVCLPDADHGADICAKAA